MKKCLLLLTLSLISSLPAHALFLIDPGAHLTFSGTSVDALNASPVAERTASGVGGGIEGRLALKKFGVFLGGTGYYNNNTYTKTKQQETTLGVVLGYSVPILPLRAFGEYYPSSTITVTSSTSHTENPFSKDDKFTGSGYGIGIGFSPLIGSFNFIYQSLEYNKRNGTTLPSTSLGKYKVSQYLVGWSLDFGWL